MKALRDVEGQKWTLGSSTVYRTLASSGGPPSGAGWGSGSRHGAIPASYSCWAGIERGGFQHHSGSNRGGQKLRRQQPRTVGRGLTRAGLVVAANRQSQQARRGGTAGPSSESALSTARPRRRPSPVARRPPHLTGSRLPVAPVWYGAPRLCDDDPNPANV